MNQKKALISCVSAGLLFFFVIFQMTLFSTINKIISQEFNLDSVAIGALSSLYFYAAAITLIPFGLMLDYRPTRKPTLFIAFLLFISILLFAAKPSLATAGLYRFACGLNNSLIFLVCMRQAPMWFPKHLSLTISLIITLGMFGGLMQTPFSILITCYGWHSALYIDALIGFVIFSIAFIGLKDNINYQFANFHKTYSRYKDLWSHLKKALLRKDNWLAGLFAGLLNLPVMVLGAMWGAYYLGHAYQLSDKQASFINSMIFLGMIIASPLIGFFSDYIQSRKTPMILGALLSVLASIGLFYTHYHFVALIILFFILGFTCTSQILSYSVVTELNESTEASTSMSLVSIILYLIGGIANPLFGWLISLGEEQQTGFIPAISLFVIAFIIALLSAVKIKESFKGK